MGASEWSYSGIPAFNSGLQAAAQIMRNRQQVVENKINERKLADLESEQQFNRGLKANEEIRKANDLAQALEHSKLVKQSYDANYKDGFAALVSNDPENPPAPEDLERLRTAAWKRAIEDNIVNLPPSMAEKAFTNFDTLQTREEIARGRDDVRKYIANQGNETRRSIAQIQDDRLRDKIERDNETKQWAAELKWSNQGQGWTNKQRELFRAHRANIEKNTDLSPEQRRYAIDDLAKRIDAGESGMGEKEAASGMEDLDAIQEELTNRSVTKPDTKVLIVPDKSDPKKVKLEEHSWAGVPLNIAKGQLEVLRQTRRGGGPSTAVPVENRNNLGEEGELNALVPQPTKEKPAPKWQETKSGVRYIVR